MDEVGSSPGKSARRPGAGARRWAVRAGMTLLILFIAAELFARFYLGLGDPPLSIADPEIEYLFKPSQDVRRFGNRIAYNAYSMRSDDFPRHRTDPRERRVMVIGDSIINGGSHTDQAELATVILQRQLVQTLGQPLIVGNISAGSWGPENMLAYVRKFGLFDADVVVIVLSSHDYEDAPPLPFRPVVGVLRDLPDRKPLLALEDLVGRYLWYYLFPDRGGAAYAQADAEDSVRHPSNIERSLAALTELIRLAQASGAAVIVAQHLEFGELSGPLLPGHEPIESTARQAGAQVVQIGPAQRQALRRGEMVHRDAMHPNAAGQRVIAEVLFQPILDALTHPPATEAAPDRIGQ